MTEIPTFHFDDTIRVDLELRDESRVGHVVGVFAHTNPGVFDRRNPASEYGYIRLWGNGGGQAKDTVTITGKVSEEMASGDYVCRYVQAYDARGNH